MGQISWIPEVVEDGYFMPCPVFTTSGRVNHAVGADSGGYFRGLNVEAAALDPGISELVHALNAASITTVGSCENITEEEDSDYPPIMIVEFLISDWVKLAAILRDDVAYNETGWLVTANPDEPQIMALMFPASEYEDFLARVRKQSSIIVS